MHKAYSCSVIVGIYLILASFHAFFFIVPQTFCVSIWLLVSRSHQILCISALTFVEVVAVVIVNSAFCLFYRAAYV